MLVHVIGGRIEVQMCTISPKSDFTIDEFKFQAASNCTDSLDSSFNLAQNCFQMMNQVMNCGLFEEIEKKI